MGCRRSGDCWTVRPPDGARPSGGAMIAAGRRAPAAAKAVKGRSSRTGAVRASGGWWKLRAAPPVKIAPEPPTERVSGPMCPMACVPAARGPPPRERGRFEPKIVPDVPGRLGRPAPVTGPGHRTLAPRFRGRASAGTRCRGGWR